VVLLPAGQVATDQEARTNNVHRSFAWTSIWTSTPRDRRRPDGRLGAIWGKNTYRVIPKWTNRTDIHGFVNRRSRVRLPSPAPHFRYKIGPQRATLGASGRPSEQRSRPGIIVGVGYCALRNRPNIESAQVRLDQPAEFPSFRFRW